VLPLILRLSQLDADAAGALRVVSFFDTLIARRATLVAVVRSTAGLAECPAGLRDDVIGRVLRQGPRGPVPDGAPDAVHEHEVALDDVRVGTVWLERPDPAGPLDAMVLERMALAAAALWPDDGSVGLSDPALVELAVSATTPDVDRARALRLLGFPAEVSVRALAVRAADARSAATAVVQCLRPSSPLSPSSPSSGLARAAVISDGEAAIVVADDRGLVPELTPVPGVRVGVGSRVAVAGLARSWQQARTAVRFAGVLGRPRGSANWPFWRPTSRRDPNVTLRRPCTGTTGWRR
jgi:hypothetical protein